MHFSIGNLVSEPRWKLPRQLSRAQTPEHAMVDWLIDTGSLTQRLIAHCRGRLSVQLVNQAFQRPTLSESQILGMPNNELAWIRQVHLLCGGKPLVFARTVIPLRSLGGPRRRLTRLGNRSLGALLFADKSMRRGEMEIARFKPRHTVFSVAIKHTQDKPTAIWGRRSVFFLGRKPLLVSEIFLPEITQAN